MPKRPVELDDLLDIRLVGDSQISPDGQRIVFTVRRADAESNGYKTALWLASCDGAGARPLTGEGHSDMLPRWSPDGTQIAFSSDRDEPGEQVYLISPDGGEARRLTKLDEGSVSELVWSPDGGRIALVFRKTPAHLTKAASKEREEKKLSLPARHHSKLFYRFDGFGYFDGERDQVYLANACSGEASAITAGDCGHASICFAPDASRLFFIANRRDDNDLTVQYDDIWSLSTSGGEPVRIPSPDGPKEALAVSPQGDRIAYLGSTDPDDAWGSKNQRVLVVPASGSETALDLTGERDLEAAYGTLSDVHESGGGAQLAWTPEGRFILFPGSERGDQRVFRVPSAGGPVEPVTPEAMEVCAFSLSGDGKRLGLALGASTKLHEAYCLDWDGQAATEPVEVPAEPRRLSAVHQEFLAKVAFQEPVPFETRAADDYSVHGWYLLPPALSEGGGIAPVVLYVHGGPALQYGGAGVPFHELQWLAAKGYLVIYSNPRGSKGYGEAHCGAIKGAWGSKDWLDIQAVADYAAAMPGADPDRMAIMGGSYGGFMTAWAVGHTNRFKCAIADRLVSNLHSMAGACDFPWEHGKFYQGNAWDDPSDLWAHSPLAYAGKIETPLLIIHSDGDLRCPVGQAEELFAALRLQRKTVEFVRYPANTSHGLSRNGPPDMRLDRLRRNLEWLQRWLA